MPKRSRKKASSKKPAAPGEGRRRVGGSSASSHRAFDRRKLHLGSQKRLKKRSPICARSSKPCCPTRGRRLPQKSGSAQARRAERCWIRPKRSFKPEQLEKRIEIERKSSCRDREVADRIAKEQPAKATRLCNWRAKSTRRHAASVHDQLQARRQLRLLEESGRLRANARRAQGPRADVRRPKAFQGADCRRRSSCTKRASPSGGP